VRRVPATAPLACGVALALLGSACDRSPASGTEPPKGRSEAIAAKQDMPTAAPAGSAAEAARHPTEPAGEAPQKLCEDELSRPGRPLAAASFTRVSAPGAEPASERLPAGRGRWTWINFFAAWCGPCKEEMPRLRGFQAKLDTALEVSFVSLDDDERQLRQFLGGQAEGASGVRAALWLPPGKGRTSWLTSLDMKDPPVLPAHVLVDPAGKVRCIFGGAIGDADFPAVAAIVRRAP
jgi:thiol-disulfide isomerase/thioredoxin